MPKQTVKFNWFRVRKSMLEGINPDENIILAQDVGEKGAKQFTYFPLNEIPIINKVLEQHNNNLYELLLPTREIKPYFDLEMEGIYDNDEKLNLFLCFVAFEINNVFGVKLELDDFVILDSCREGKLSYHVLIKNKVYFNNNKECGQFVKYLMYRFNNPQNEEEGEIIKELTWFYKGTNKRYIFDDVPYGNYQQFRLINQSKKGKPYKLSQYNNDDKYNDYWVSLYDGVGNRERLNPEVITIQYQNIKRVIDINNKVAKKEKPIQNATETQEMVEDWSFNFNTEGATLSIKYDLDYDDLLKYPQWKQYLYLIVNNNSSYLQWRNIGMAIAMEGGNEKDWKEWSELNTTNYTPGETSSFKKFNNTIKEGETNYDIRTLRKLAKLCHPEFFNKKNECFSEYFDLDLTGVKSINETSDFLSEEGTKEENNIFTDDKIIIKFAGCGKGKTTSIKRMMKHYDFKSYLFLSPRIAFATFISGEFGCDCYIDKYSQSMVVSLESIMNIPEEFEYEFIVIDECESILKQFSSPTMNGQYLDAFQRLTTYIKKRKK